VFSTVEGSARCERVGSRINALFHVDNLKGPRWLVCLLAIEKLVRVRIIGNPMHKWVCVAPRAHITCE
jgi:hypothetical protein